MNYVSIPTVMLGTNKFDNCKSIMALGTEPMLAFIIKDGILHVTLHVTSPPATTRVKIERTAKQEVNIKIEKEVVLVARLNDDHTVEVETFDLRPIGLAIHADTEGLHVGRSVMRNNAIKGCNIGISLGS